MQVSKINYSPNFRSSSFRDEELFNESIDLYSSDYSKYDEDELPIGGPQGNIVDTNYSQLYGLSILGPKHLRNIYDPQIDNSHYCNVDSEFIIDEDLYDASMLQGKNTKRFSGILYNHLKSIHEDKHFSYADLADICNNIKLKRADNSEYMDFEFFDAAIYLLEKLKNKNDIQSINNLLSELKEKDENGNEVFFYKGYDHLKSSMYQNTKIKNTDFYTNMLKYGKMYNEDGIAIGMCNEKLHFIPNMKDL